jgi:hippurate hydrolase
MQGSNSPTEEAVGAAPEFRALRRDLHAHPELGFDVHRTARIVADKLREWGVSVTPDVGISGLVGSITAGASRRSIGLRADMDALPVHEANEFAHRSTHQGRMHACGHDGHTVMLLAAAQYLSRTRQFDGTVHLIFQPAEEGGAAGARKMIDDGLFERFPCDAVFGMHNWPGLPVGRFAVARGPMMASTAQFEISVNGRGGHAAMPHNAIDPIAVAAQIYGALQTVISRRRKPIDPAVLSVSQFNAGSTVNVVPETAVLRGTVRTFSDTVMSMIEEAMRTICTNTAAAFGASSSVTFQRAYPALVNHALPTDFAIEVMQGLVGSQYVDTAFEPTMGAEDFSFMLQRRPGCFVFIGNGEGEHREQGGNAGPCVLHSAQYDFNDAVIPLGARYWVRLVEAWLRSADHRPQGAP